jgi:glutamate N-acetyltransferase/amino-acid N-acetyltransferase
VGPGDEQLFADQLAVLCQGLARDIVANGEGTQHVIRVEVVGAPSEEVARGVGKAVVNSNLVKCAISGCDPNVGRVLAAIGSYLGSLPLSIPLLDQLTGSMEVELGGFVIFSDNSFKLDPAMEKRLSDYLLDCQLFPSALPEEERNFPYSDKTVEIVITFKDTERGHRAVVFGSDLTKEYVEINADYRS